MQPHYVYSPRELTRWVRGMCEAIRPLDTLSCDALVRLWAHEALRLFHDRCVIHLPMYLLLLFIYLIHLLLLIQSNN